MTASEKPVRFASRRRCGGSGGRDLRKLLRRVAAAEGGEERPQPLVGGLGDAGGGVDVTPGGVLPEERAAAELQGAEGLAQRRLEGAVDRHHLAGGLHLGAG